MNRHLKIPIVIHLVCSFFLFITQEASACSMCKITSGGKTIVGNNEDAWRKDSRIWFEKGGIGKYGAAYIGHNDGFPQGGMNEAGLAFDGFTVYPRTLHPVSGKKSITNPREFVKNILQHCATVDEVKKIAIEYDRSLFNNSMLLFVDKSGRYLVMEVDTLIEGNDSTYILSNFCPSKTKPEDVEIDRYHRGISYLTQHLPQATIEYGTALMDTMHECRAKIGDGTTYTSMYDLTEGLITLYFYHDFSKKYVFRLQDELKKPDSIWHMTALFTDNKEYQAFISYMTPFNTPHIQGTMMLGRFFYLATAVLFIFFFIRSLIRPAPARAIRGYNYLIFAATNILFWFFIGLLLTNQPIYYFDSPYSFGNPLVNVMAYLPLALLIGFVLIVFIAFKLIKTRKPNYFVIFLLSLNILTYLAILIGAGYWGLLEVF